MPTLAEPRLALAIAVGALDGDDAGTAAAALACGSRREREDVAHLLGSGYCPHQQPILAVLINVHPGDLDLELLVAHRARRRRSALGGPIRRRGELQRPAQHQVATRPIKRRQRLRLPSTGQNAGQRPFPHTPRRRPRGSARVLKTPRSGGISTIPSGPRRNQSGPNPKSISRIAPQPINKPPRSER